MQKEKVFCESCEVMCPAPSILKNATIKETINMLKKQSKTYESIDYIYVTEEDRTLIGVFSIKELFKHSSEIKIIRIMTSKVFSISSKSTSEHIADLSLKYGIKSIPITENGKLIGMIPPKNVTHMINKSLRKDIFHFAGIHHSHLEYENTLKVPLGKSVWHRVPWLVIGLIGIMLTAAFIDTFESILSKHIILAFFIPAIVYISDALGTQIQTLFIRDLAVMGEKLKVGKYLMKQILISLIIAIILSSLIFLGISIFWKEQQIGWVISIAAFSSLIIATLTSIGITYILKRMSKDPALGGGPFATVISDATSIIVYFLITSAML